VTVPKGRPSRPAYRSTTTEQEGPTFGEGTVQVPARICQLVGNTERPNDLPVRVDGFRRSRGLPETGAWASPRTTVGQARPGPSPTRQPSGCDSHPDNQDGLIAYAAAIYSVCVPNGI
jgi:hypothetical protein